MEIIWLKMENIWLKMEAIWLKMEAIWLKMEVVWLLEPPGARSSHPTEDRWKNGWPPGRPGSPPGTQRDPKNRLKTVFLLKKGDPHETSYFTMRKLRFHFPCFCVFLKRNVEKWSQNAKSNFASQNHQRTVPGDLFWVQKWSRINVGEAKKPKNDTRAWTPNRSLLKKI